MAELAHYETVVNGLTTTLRLTENDAKRRGLTKKAAPAAQEKAAPAKRSSTPAK